MFRKKANFSLSSSSFFKGDDLDAVFVVVIVFFFVVDDIEGGDVSTFVGLPGNDTSIPD